MTIRRAKLDPTPVEKTQRRYENKKKKKKVGYQDPLAKGCQRDQIAEVAPHPRADD